MMKRVLALLLTLVLVASLLPVMALATGGLTIAVDTSGVSEINAGDSFTVPVTISGNTVGFTNFDLEVTYDTTKLTLTNILKGSGSLSNNMALFTGNKDTGRASGAGVSDEYIAENPGATSITGDGTMFRLYFTVKSSAASGSAIISIGQNPDAAAAIKNGNTFLTPTFVPGTISIVGDTSEKTVRFMNGATQVGSSITTTYGAVIPKAAVPAAPTKTGYHFIGWYKDVSGLTDYIVGDAANTAFTGELFQANKTQITADTDFYAVWRAADAPAVMLYEEEGVPTVMPFSTVSAALQNAIYADETVALVKDVTENAQTGASTRGTLDLGVFTLTSTGYTLTNVEDATLTIIGDDTDGGIMSVGGTYQQKAVTNDNNATLIVNSGRIDGHYAISYNGTVTVNGGTLNATQYGIHGSGALNINGGTITAAGIAIYAQQGTINITGGAITSTGKDGIAVWNYGTPNRTTVTVSQADEDVPTVITGSGGNGIAANNGPLVTVNGGHIRGAYNALWMLGPDSGAVINGGKIEGLGSGGDAVWCTAGTAAINGGLFKGASPNGANDGGTITYAEGKMLSATADAEGFRPLADIGFTVTFMNYDGSATYLTTPYETGSTASYTGDDPIRETDGEYDYTFSHWSATQGGVAVDFSGITTDTTLYAVYDSILHVAAAKIGETSYDTLAQAIAAVPTDGTETLIVLQKNVTEDIAIGGNKNIILDVGDYTITGVDSGAGKACVTVEGSSTVFTLRATDGAGNHTGTGGIDASVCERGVAAGDTCTVNIQSGFVTAKTYGIRRAGSGYLNVSGGSISGGSYGVAAWCTTNITGGVITGQTGIEVDGGSGWPTTISGGSITGAGMGVVVYGKADVSGGTITGGQYAGIEVDGGTLNMTGGEVRNISGANNAISVWDSGSTLNITGGYIHCTSYGALYDGTGGNSITIGGTAKFNSADTTNVVGGATGTAITINGGYFLGNNSRPTFGSTVMIDESMALCETPEASGDYAGYYGVKSFYTVTFKSEDGATTLDTAAVLSGETAVYGGTTPTKAADPDGTTYAFDKWVTTQGGDLEADLRGVTGNMTVYASFTVIPGTIVVPPEDIPVTTDEETGEKKAEVVVPVDFNPGEDVDAEIVAKSGEEGVTESQAIIPATTIENIKVTNSTNFKLDVADVAFNKAALTDIAENAGANDVTLVVSKLEKTALLAAQRAVVEDGATIIDLSLTAADNPISFSVGTATIKIPFTKPDENKSYGAFFIAANGVRTAVPSRIEGGFMLITASHFSVYATGELADYEMKVLDGGTEGTHYHVGDTITADIYAYATEATTFGSFQFTLDYDAEKLTLGTVTTELEGEYQQNNGTANYTYIGEVPVDVSPDGTKIATATFTVKTGISTGTTTISLAPAEMTKDGSYSSNAPSVVGGSFALYEMFTVSFAAPTNGSLSSTTALTIEDGALLSTLTLPTPTANEHYSFSGWFIGNDEVTPASYTVTSDIELTARFAPDSYDITFTAPTGASYGETITGVADGKVTHDTDVTFTATANSGYVITGVSYTVGGDVGGTIPLADGKYTIAGENITGAIVVEVSTLRYHTVTFNSGTGATVTGSPVTAYVKNNTAGFWTDTTFTTQYTAPTPVAQSGYRLAKNDATEPLWMDASDNGYTSASIAEAVFTADQSFTAQAVKTYVVTFAAGENGSLTGTTPITVDTGYALLSTDIPTPTPNTGYQFKEWQVGGAAATPLGATINADVTYNAIFENGVYNITFDGGNAATFTRTGDFTEGKATFGTNVTFTMALSDNYAVTAVQYSIDGGEATTIEAVDGVYTIPGASIIGNVSVTVDSNQTYTITFAAGENGSVSGGPFVIDKGSKLTQNQLDDVTKTPAAGYTFVEWQIDGAAVTVAAILDTAYDAATTITAVFGHATFNVTVPEGVTGIEGTATHGSDLTFTPVETGDIVTGVTVTIYGEPVTVTANEDGSYTIDGDLITGPININVNTIAGAAFSFITYAEYKGLASNTKIAVLTTAKLTDGRYTLSDGTELYWSSKYSAYIKIVPDTATAATLSAGLTTDATATTDVDYSGDLNCNGSTTAADAMIINDILHSRNQLDAYNVMRLKADVTGDETVTTADIIWTLKTAVGLDPTAG